MAGASQGTDDQKPGAITRARTYIGRRRSAICVIALAVGMSWLVAAEWWPFDGSDDVLEANPSLWRSLLSERLTLGFVRLALAGASFYVLASIIVRMAHDEWLRKAGGAEAGKAEQWADDIQNFRNAANRAVEERDAYRSELKEYKEMVDIETAPHG